MELSKEVIDKIEQRRQEALKKRAARLSSQPSNSVPSPLLNSNSNVPVVKNAFSLNASTNRLSVSNTVDKLAVPSSSFYSTSNSLPKGGNNLPLITTKTETICQSPWSSKPSTSTSKNSSVSTISGAKSHVGSSNNFSKFVDKKSARCVLISKERFIVDLGYHGPTIEIFRTIQSALYEPQTKRWSFLLKDYDTLMLALRAVSSEVTFGSLPTAILQTFRNNPPPPINYDLDLSKIDSELVSSLMPFQREGVCFGISKQGRCLIADDMGLGKTIQALGIVKYYKEDWPLLIVSPSSVRYLWEDAITQWLPSVPIHHITVMTSGKDYIQEAKVLIVSYDLLSRHEKELKKFKFGVIIMDECHFLKNMKSARTQAGLSLIAAAKRVLLLSGTPALSRPSELFTLLKAIDSKCFPRFQEFGIRYCDGKQGTFGWDFQGSSNMQELQLLLSERFMIRRLKSDVITQLPDKFRQMVVLNPDSVKSTSKDMKKFVKMLESTDLKGMERQGTLMEYYNSTGIAKLKAIQDYVTDLLESGQKFLVFAHHKAVIDGISDLIDKKKQKFIRIDGGTNPKVRQKLCDSFQMENDVVAAVLSITAANAGITLTAAHLVVFAELFWNPGILTQAEDRAHRIGQKDSVVVRYLVAKGTADDHLWPLIIKKLDVLNKAGLSKDNFLDSSSVHLKDSKQPTIESYFEALPSDWLMDNADEWLSEVNLEEFDIPQKKPKLS